MRWLDRLRAQPRGAGDAEAQAAAHEPAPTPATTPTALAIWEPLAQAGVARAQNNIGACFADGLGVEADPIWPSAG